MELLITTVEELLKGMEELLKRDALYRQASILMLSDLVEVVNEDEGALIAEVGALFCQNHLPSQIWEEARRDKRMWEEARRYLEYAVSRYRNFCGYLPYAAAYALATAKNLTTVGEHNPAFKNPSQSEVSQAMRYAMATAAQAQAIAATTPKGEKSQVSGLTHPPTLEFQTAMVAAYVQQYKMVQMLCQRGLGEAELTDVGAAFQERIKADNRIKVSYDCYQKSLARVARTFTPDYIQDQM